MILVNTKHVLYICTLYANTQYVHMYAMCQHDIVTYVVYMRIHSTFVFNTCIYCTYIHIYILYPSHVQMHLASAICCYTHVCM